VSRPPVKPKKAAARVARRADGAKSKKAPPSTVERVRRLLFLVPFVAAREEGVPLEELALRLCVPEDELLAEIDLLCQVGPPAGDPSDFLLLSVEDGRVFVDLPQKLVRPPRLSAQEAFALLLGAQALRGSGISHHEDALSRAEAKIRRALGSTQAPALARIESDIVLGHGDAAGLAVVPELSRAARARRAVDIEYYSAGRGESKRRGVDPYGLVNHLGSWYLVGRCHINDEPRVFKCERIALVELRPEKFSLPQDFSLERFQRDRLRLPTARGGRVKLRFVGEAARSAARWEGAHKVAGGAVEVSLEMAPNEWLLGWVLGFGGEATVTEPADFRAAVRDRLRAIASEHGS
jgi:proteasome accessory factor C